MIALAKQRARQRGRIHDVDVPETPVVRNRLEMDVAGEDGPRRLRAPAGQSGIPVRRVTDEGEVIGYRHRRYAELRDHRGFVPDGPRSAIQLDDPRAAHALGEILVGRADDHAFDAPVVRRRRSGGGQGIVGLELDHRPDHDAHRGERLFEERELRQEVGLDAGARFVP